MEFKDFNNLISNSEHGTEFVFVILLIYSISVESKFSKTLDNVYWVGKKTAQGFQKMYDK